MCVSDFGNHRLQLVSALGDPLRIIPLAVASNAASSTADSSADNPVGSLTPCESRRPLGIALGSQGLFVASAANVQLLDHDGHAIHSLEGCTNPMGAALEHTVQVPTRRRLCRPCGVAIGPHGQLFVSDKVISQPHPVATITNAIVISTRVGKSPGCRPRS